MNYDIIRIGMEAELSLELHRLFQGEIIERIMQDAKVEPESDHSKDLLGNDFKISARMAPGLFELCQQVLDQLKFKEKTDFFVFNSSEVDCFAHPSFYTSVFLLRTFPDVCPKGSYHEDGQSS